MCCEVPLLLAKSCNQSQGFVKFSIVVCVAEDTLSTQAQGTLRETMLMPGKLQSRNQRERSLGAVA